MSLAVFDDVEKQFLSLFTLFSLLAHVSAEACKCITDTFLRLFTLFLLSGHGSGEAWKRRVWHF